MYIRFPLPHISQLLTTKGNPSAALQLSRQHSPPDHYKMPDCNQVRPKTCQLTSEGIYALGLP